MGKIQPGFPRSGMDQKVKKEHSNGWSHLKWLGIEPFIEILVDVCHSIQRKFSTPLSPTNSTTIIKFLGVKQFHFHLNHDNGRI